MPRHRSPHSTRASSSSRGKARSCSGVCPSTVTVRPFDIPCSPPILAVGSAGEVDMQILPAQPRLPRRKVGAARGAAFGAAVGLPLGAVAGVIVALLDDQLPLDSALLIIAGLALYGALLGSVHFALQQAVGKRR